MKTSILAATAALVFAAPAFAGNYASGPSYTPDALPPSSNPGECWARVKVPAKYETVSQTVMTHAPYQTMKVTQPKFQSRQEQVMVKEPSVRYEVRQPTFKSVSETIMTRPSYEKLSVTPPRFENVQETLTMSEPKLVWKKGNPGELRRQGYIIHSTADGGAYGQGYSSTTHYGAVGGDRCGATCEIWCLVEEPGVRQSFSRRVMTSPGGVQRHSVPAQYQTITKQVVADPGGVREVPVPGEYRSVTVQDMVDPGGAYHENVPPQYGKVQGKVIAETERYEWRRVLCQPGTQHKSPAHNYERYPSGGYGGTGGYMDERNTSAGSMSPLYQQSFPTGAGPIIGGDERNTSAGSMIYNRSYSAGPSVYQQPAYGSSEHYGHSGLAGGHASKKRSPYYK